MNMLYEPEFICIVQDFKENDLRYQEFLWEFNELDFKLKTYLHIEGTAQKYLKKLFSPKSNSLKAIDTVKIPQYIVEMFPYDYYAFHLFNRQESVEFQFENPIEEIKSVIINKTAFKNVEILTLYLSRL